MTKPTVALMPEGELMRLVADGLASRGCVVQLPASDDERRLKVEYGGSRCDLLVEDCGYVDMELYPPAGGLAPGLVTDITAFLLDAENGRGQDQEGEDPGRKSFRRIIGEGLLARGLVVGLEVYEDSASFEVIVELEVSNPAASGATLLVGDDGTVTWELDCQDGVAGITGAPDGFAAQARRDELAGSVTGRVFRAMSLSSGGEE